MYAALCILTALVLCGAAMGAYTRWGDALHPAIVLAPPFLYTMAVWPLLLYEFSNLREFFHDDQLIHVHTIYLAGIICLCCGLVSVKPRRRRFRIAEAVSDLSPRGRKRFFRLSCGIGTVALSAYWYSLYYVGGVMAAYSRYKGGGRAPSGYISEAILFSFPAVLGIAVYRRMMGGRVRRSEIFLALLFMSPHLIQGTLGGRRGPIFLALASLVFAWLIARGKRVRMSVVALGIGVAGLAVLFVYSQRRHVYLGSEGQVKTERVLQTVVPEELSPGNTYVFSSASILTAEHWDRYYWGYRYFVTFFVRPIPRQLWPTKYEDTGATWIMNMDESAKAAEMAAAVGFDVERGAAPYSIADAYLEFKWGMLPFFFLVGWSFSKAWVLHRTQGGQWTIVYSVMLALSVYLATQTFTAFAHRALFICVPTLVVWKYWLRQGRKRRPRFIVEPRALRA